MNRFSGYLALLCWIPCTGLLARHWEDASGRFKIEADFFSANDETVIIKKANGDLVAFQINQLSSGDQAYVQEQRKVLDEEKAKVIDDPYRFQTWTSRDGFELLGKVISFGQREVVITRESGTVMVNGTAFKRLNKFYQYIIPKIVAEYADPTVKDEQGIGQWLKKNHGNPPPFKVEGVLMKLEDGDELAIPFFVFSDEDLAILRPGWEAWKGENASEETRKREDYLMSVEADRYKRDEQQRQQQQAEAAATRQIQMMQLEMMAVQSGVASVWEVLLQPLPGTYLRPTSVLVTAQNSELAERMVLQKYRGYRSVGVRRASF